MHGAADAGPRAASTTGRVAQRGQRRLQPSELALRGRKLRRQTAGRGDGLRDERARHADADAAAAAAGR
eukprot:126993-Chlamydomonas_euryale.AAC.1